MGEPFVIQIHSGYGEKHFDMMLASGEALATWQLAASPADLPVGAPLPARRLADHRSEYLTYEGPVSRGRGRVDILDSGTFELLKCQPLRWEFRLAGHHIAGRFELVCPGNDEVIWTLRRLE